MEQAILNPRTGGEFTLKRITAKLAQGFTRLAFWRKPAAPTPEPTATPPEAQQDLKAVEASPSVSVEQTEPKLGRFARLKLILRRWRAPAPEQPMAPDQPLAGMERAPRESPEANADQVPLAKPSLLARLKTTFRRQPAPEEVIADEPMADARRNRDPSHPSQAEDGVSEESPVQRGRMRRALAVLAKKWVWIPAVSVMLLAIMGALLMQLQQSAQEQEKLQAELRATQQKLEQASGAKKPTSKQAAAKSDAPGQPNDLALASAGGGETGLGVGLDEGGCVVTDKESVSQNLKSCINEFNRSMPGTRPAEAAP